MMELETGSEEIKRVLDTFAETQDDGDSCESESIMLNNFKIISYPVNPITESILERGDELEILIKEDANNVDLKVKFADEEPWIEIIRDAEFNHEETPLETACRLGHLSAVKLLIEHGVSVKPPHPPNRLYCLHWACMYGHHKVVEFLLQNGADIDYVSEEGNSALYHAVRHQQLKVIQVLAFNGAKINGSPDVLQRVILEKNFPVFYFLAAAGIEIDADEDYAKNYIYSGLYKADHVSKAFLGMFRLLGAKLRSPAELDEMIGEFDMMEHCGGFLIADGWLYDYLGGRKCIASEKDIERIKTRERLISIMNGRSILSLISLLPISDEEKLFLSFGVPLPESKSLKQKCRAIIYGELMKHCADLNASVNALPLPRTLQKYILLQN